MWVYAVWQVLPTVAKKNIALLTESGKSPARLHGAISSGQGLDQISSGKM